METKITSWGRFCGKLLKWFGWTVDSAPTPDDKAIILAAPHTSLLDFPVCYLFYKSIGETPHALVKKELFFWPMGTLLRKMGAIPLDRSNATASMKRVIDEVRNAEGRFHLSIAPEGTRKPVKKWKTGYHTLATAIGCPVYLGYIDWKHKHIGTGERMDLTGTPREDTDRIQAAYARLDVAGRHPEKFQA